MFCPNCGGNDQGEQNYCRSCGLKLDAISKAVAEQTPSKEYAALQRRKDLFEKLGLLSLATSAVIGAVLLIAKVGYYKIMLFGPELIFGSALAALIVFGLLSVFFFNYPKLFMNFDKLDRRHAIPESVGSAATTSKLIDDRVFEPVPSVTENTTNLLPVSEKPRSAR